MPALLIRTSNLSSVFRISSAHFLTDLKEHRFKCFTITLGFFV
ncbi:hypothetical protein X975_26039, partial [Stegodyphus mimosarum]